MKLAQAQNRKQVCCIETGEIFESVTMAAEHYKINSGEISEVCNKKRTTAGKMHWVFLEDWLSITNQDAVQAECLEKQAHCRKSIRCIETGEIFLSIREAAQKYGVDHKSICRACKKLSRTSSGMHWEICKN